MGALFIGSIAFGRQSTGWVALVAAAAVMTFHDPRVVHAVAFQLSFAAVLGLVVLAMPLRERLERLFSRWPSVRDFPLSRPAFDLLAMSVASIAFTLPITAINFHQVSLVAPLANLFAAPAFVAVAGTSAVLAVAGMVSPEAADWLAWFAWPPAAYMTGVIELFAGLPLAEVSVKGFSTIHALGYYAVLAAAATYVRRIEPVIPEAPAAPIRVPVRGLSAAAIAMVIGLSGILAWLAVSVPAENRLSVTVLDVGQGEALLIETPGDRRVLVDGGPSGAVLKAALGRHLPFYDRRLDLVLLTHPQADHAGGLPAVLEQYDVATVLSGSGRSSSGVGRSWDRMLAATGIPVEIAKRGQVIQLGGGAELTVLNPESNTANPSANDSSVVVRLSYGSFSMLLTGDIGEDGEGALMRTGTRLEATVLKVAHHGSRTSTSSEFLHRVNPSIALISAGKDNAFGHPTPEVLERLSGRQVLRTDERGDITVTTDGEHVWVDSQR
jgi:competence protein ComEC